MPRVIGIDPGTFSFDLCGLDDGQIFLDLTVPSPDVARAPQELIAKLHAAGPLDLVVGPSGYGLPWVRAHDLTERDIALALLADERERNQPAAVGGMDALLRALKRSGLPIIFMPGVVHLPTVPAYRKANAIDMGTADKLCCAALGIVDQARRLDLAYDHTAFVYVEIGGAFTSVLAVQHGQVVDGVGGSRGALGWLSLGGIDGELAYLLGTFPKATLFSGGVADMIEQRDLGPDASFARRAGDERVHAAWEALFESVVKIVAAEMTVVPDAREILLSGRLSRIEGVRAELEQRLGRWAPVRHVGGIGAQAKEAAQGAAIIADGLAGGQFAPLIARMRLREAQGTVLDHLYVRGADAIRRRMK